VGESCANCPQDCGICTPQCNDGIDNDGDGLIDFNPAPGQGDPGCSSPMDNSEVD
jgi:hypothetical protein